MLLWTLISAGVGVALLAIIALVVVNLRRVVPTNEVHIVQTRNDTTSYGKGMESGNTYYEWPSWLPIWGLTKMVMPVSVFDIKLSGYEAYDKERVPFVVDVVAFFRIHDSNTAAQRVASFPELREQLTNVVQGAIRTVLAKHDINHIMVDRAQFSTVFTDEVETQLKNWGVEPVKNIELMDIRDAGKSAVIHSIMAIRTSAIEMESRTAVATNHKLAQIAEVEAQREVDLQQLQAQQRVGERQAEKERMVGISQQQATQAVAEQARVTREKEMAVLQVETVQQAEITKQEQIIVAEQNARTAVVTAEAEKAKTVLVAEGKRDAKLREAEGIKAEGTAHADARKAMELAPVAAQIELAKEIGANQPYQQYLLTLKQIEVAGEVGKEQAAALEQADVKIITNAGSPVEGMRNVMDLFSPRGGTALGGMLEAFVQTDTGKRVVEKMTEEKA